MIFIGSDHGGYKLKEYLKQNLKKELIDLGTDSQESCDYPKIAKNLANEVVKNNTRGILICGSGVGMSIAANKVKGARAVLVYDENIAEMSRKHNDANIICLGERYLSEEKSISLINKFLNTGFDGNVPEGIRHKKRVDQIEN